MKITHFNTTTEGGAAVLMLRLHQGLLDAGVNSEVFYRKGQLADSKSQALEFAQSRVINFQEKVKYRLENKVLKQPGNLFSTLRSPTKTPLPSSHKLADIYHLHWISRWLDLPSFMASLPAQAPIIFTLHDFGNFTGGCHLYSGCREFEATCQSCPLLKAPFDRFLARQELKQKQKSLNSHFFHVVGNSSWTTAMASCSAVFQEADSIRTIPPGVDLEKFINIPKSEAKRLLGISPEKFVIGFGCAELTDGNKNFSMFLELLKRLSEILDLEAIVFGNGFKLEKPLAIPIHNLGKLDSSDSLSRAYSAMDVFVMTSQIETFGQVALEAQACETPVCAFGVGGLKDAISDATTGFLSTFGNIPEMTAQVIYLAQNPENCQTFGRQGRKRVQANFTLDTTISAYMDLYQEALKK